MEISTRLKQYSKIGLITNMALIGYALVSYWWIIGLLDVLAVLGAGAMDAGLNMYVAV